VSGSIEEALADCLDRIETGGATLDEALDLYPGLAAELEPLLFLSAELRSMPKVEAPASLRGYKRPIFRPAPERRRWDGLRRLLPTGVPSIGRVAPLARVAAALAVAMLATGGTIVASASSLPEEPLFPVKLAVENAQLALAPTNEARADLELSFAARRVAEVQSAAQQGKPAAVAQGVALYEEKVDAAIKASQAASPPTAAETERVQDSLRQNQRVLAQVLDKVDNPKAKSAIQHAIAAPGANNSGSGNGSPSNDKAALPPATAASAGPSPTAVVAPAVVAASPTGTPEPADSHEPHGKAIGHSDGPNAGDSGQVESPTVTPQGAKQQNGSDKPGGKPGASGDAGRGQASANSPATAISPDPSPTATPASPSATAQPAAGGQGQANGNAQGNGNTHGNGNAQDNGKGQSNGNGQSNGSKGKDVQK
jgi:hypothetical protein